MKITIELDDSEIENIAWTNPPHAITSDRASNIDEIKPCIRPGSYYWNKQQGSDNGWIDGVDCCANCPNRPGGPNNKSGFCMCAIPSMFGPNRITC